MSQFPASAAAHQYAGYAQFYGNAPPRGPPMRPPPPPPRGLTLQPPPQYQYQQARPGFVQPPPRPVVQLQASAGSRWDRAPQQASPHQAAPLSNTSNWQWSTGRPENQAPNKLGRFGPATEVASAPPKMYTPKPPAVSKFSSQPPPTPAPPAGGESTQWPPALKAYVERAFQQARNEGDKTRIQAILKEKISSALTANQLWSKNWNAEPLPLQASAATVPNGPPMGSRPPQLRPPPPRPHVAGPRPLVPPPRPSFVPGGGPVPPPRPSGFIPLEHAKGPSQKATKRKQLDEDPDGNDMRRKLQRQQRFLKDSFAANKTRVPTLDDSRPLQVLTDDGELDLEAMVIKGTCMVVEKEYLRLTSAPHPSTVRPEPVLRKALELVRKKWKKGKCDYIYVCSQMKSIRQDCTVQHIKNDFTVLVYESHARIALEEGDMNEFNQCQTQLHQLYDHGVAGHAREFLAYRILYCIYVCLQAKADVNTGNLGMAKVLSKVAPADREDPAVAHALDVREAVALNNFALFFHLYAAAPKMSGYIMDAYVDHVRLQALRIMCKAYQPSIPLAYVKAMLRLEGKDGEAFVAESGLRYVDARAADLLIDVKASEIVTVRSNAKSLL
ncbi:leukocyte receptor cluster member 8 [Achlya hypogyna]|uniref:Leukocyte receptor cluster member 8 n=1 Tax=Achlya hypogyna TaxID=1202772 RepID=A0A1V9Z8Z8_ACHHY|nr:leukocyte receptor cluster member 8 [Achlya hypogyna]